MNKLKKIKASTLLAVVLSMLLFGCDVGKTEQQRQDDGSTYLKGASASGSVQLVELSDGTKCAVLIGSSKGGIDCEWNVAR